MKPNSKTRQLRKQKALQRRGARKQKEGAESPKNPLQQLVDFVNKLQADLVKLTKNVQLAVGQLYQNEQNTKLGLDAAEFNLRAHQKVLNALAQDVLAEQGATAHLSTLEVEMPATPDHPAGKTTAINWPLYHKYVEEEMRAIAEEARKADLELRTKQVKELEDTGKLQRFKEHVFASIDQTGEDKAEREARANAFFADTYEQMALVKAGKEYSGSKLDVLIRMVEEADKHDKGAETPKEEIGTLSDPPAEADEDTTVFGG